MELNIERGKVTIDSLQTGDVAEERRSGKAPKYDHRIRAFEGSRVEGIAF